MSHHSTSHGEKNIRGNVRLAVHAIAKNKKKKVPFWDPQNRKGIRLFFLFILFSIAANFASFSSFLLRGRIVKEPTTTLNSPFVHSPSCLHIPYVYRVRPPAYSNRDERNSQRSSVAFRKREA